MYFKLKNIFRYLLISVVYLFVGLWITYPLVANITSKIPTNLYVDAEHNLYYGDHLQIVAGFREQKNLLRNILQGEESYRKEFCFDPSTENCMLGKFETINKIIFSPFHIHTSFDLFVDDPTAYNLSILASFVIVGLMCYLMAEYFYQKMSWPVQNEITKNLVIFVSSLFLVMLPYRVHHLLVGHRNGWLVAIVPAIMLLVEWVIDAKSTSKKMLGIQGLLIILFLYAANTEKFVMLYAFLYVGIRVGWACVCELARKWSTIDRYDFWAMGQKYTWIPIAAVLALWSNASGTLQHIAASDLEAGRSFEVIIGYSGEINYLWTPNIFEHEHNIYLGIGIFIFVVSLMLCGYAIGRGGGLRKIGLEYLVFVVVGLFFLLITLGSNTPFYRFLYDYLPTFKFSRTPTRAILAFAPVLCVISVYMYAVVSDMIARIHLSEQFKATLLNLIILTIGIFTVWSFAPNGHIPMAGLPSVPNIVDGEKVLFVPYVSGGDFYGSYHEFILSHANATSPNGYSPYVPNEAIEFESKYAEVLNDAHAKGQKVEDLSIWPEIKEKYGVDRVVYLD